MLPFFFLKSLSLQIQQMKQHQMLKNRAYAQAMDFQVQRERKNVGDDIAQGLSMPAWPTSQPPHQKSGSGMRAVFLGESAVKKERTGTGVFIPQRFGSFPPENRKKPGTTFIQSNHFSPVYLLCILNL